ncbi:type IV secretory system conjugative DNA transfer family protein, partial [Leuconostoc citreum]|uniref:type IV secretory system conjugative DNA transfer family protein n=1 Tax=Leuconostoc citreum TaxID=33964 RepID=UPI00345BBD7A
MAGIKAEQLASLMNELRNTLIVFATDPVLRKLSGNGTSVVPQDIEENWIYLVLPESKLQVYSRYLSLIVSQFTRYLTQRPEKAQPNVLMALDEFPRLGFMPAFTDAISTLRSRNVSVMILLQSLAQLDKIYQENGRKVIMDNMHYVNDALILHSTSNSI